MSIKISDKDWAAFFTLLERVEVGEPMPRADVVAARLKRRIDHKTMSRAEIQAIVQGPKPKALSFFARQDHKEFRKSIANDLGAQVKIVSDLLDDQRDYGELMAPAYARRIGVILRKAKRRDLSDRFEQAYRKHAEASYH